MSPARESCVRMRRPTSCSSCCVSFFASTFVRRGRLSDASASARCAAAAASLSEVRAARSALVGVRPRASLSTRRIASSSAALRSAISAFGGRPRRGLSSPGRMTARERLRFRGFEPEGAPPPPAAGVPNVSDCGVCVPGVSVVVVVCVAVGEAVKLSSEKRSLLCWFRIATIAAAAGPRIGLPFAPKTTPALPGDLSPAAPPLPRSRSCFPFFGVHESSSLSNLAFFFFLLFPSTAPGGGGAPIGDTEEEGPCAGA
mmetsp:Transcript_26381/g.86550  ORF Transcript_26381/g.86550 Transcript_26381/m.86550 type:complete len:257 (-) Transcript_26381:268-1038(-)